MLKTIDRIEGALVRAEGIVLVVCVVAMLVLAAYNVFYRNVLVPLQSRLSTSGPAVTERPDPADSERPTGEATDSTKGTGGDDFGGGFGAADDGGTEEDEAGDEDATRGFKGGFGGESEESPPDENARPSRSTTGGSGFEGGFESGEPASKGGAEDDTSATNESGFEGGFGGGASDDESRSGFEGGFGSGEADAPASGDDSGETRALEERAGGDGTSGEETDAGGGPPREGTLAAGVVEFVDAVKLGWIDVFLRHMVLVVGFLGAMIAVRRREHITIDAVGQYVSDRWRYGFGALTGLFAAVVSVVLAKAGWDLVALGLERPEDLFPGVRQWAVQLVFPIGFGLIAVHFGLRAVGDGVRAYTGELDDDESGGAGSETGGTRDDVDVGEGGRG